MDAVGEVLEPLTLNLIGHARTVVSCHIIPSEFFSLCEKARNLFIDSGQVGCAQLCFDN
jgi:hypothetical protein